MRMSGRVRKCFDARLVSGLVAGFALAVAFSVGAAERMVLGEYFTSVF
jgi:hypothetical protein